jgi:hypothetical protein
MGYTLLDDSGAPVKGTYTLLPDDAPKAKDAAPGILSTIAGFAGKNGLNTALSGPNLIGKGLSAIGDALSPAPSLSDLVSGKKPTNFIGQAGQAIQDAVARGKASMSNTMAPYQDAHPTAAVVGDTAGDVIKTLPAGMGLGAVARAVMPAIATSRIAPLLTAIETGGMKTGVAPAATLAGKAVDMGTRMLGGGITGAASTAMVDPSNVGTGGGIGAIAPVAFGAAGKIGNAMGRVISGPDVSPAVQAGVQAATKAGYVVPPTQASPTLANRLMEGMAGKISTAQNASAKNQAVTNGLAATALGLPAETQLSPGVLNQIRQNAGRAYDAVASTGTITPGPAYEQALDSITAQARQAAAGFPNAKPSAILSEIDALKSPQFDASSAVSKIQQLRDQASSAYASGDKSLGAALKAGAGVLEDTIDQHLQQIGAPPDLLDGFRNARQLIAKTYSVEKALNPTSGTVDAQKLAAQLNRGKPLSGDLLTAAQFAQQFPKAAQPVEKMGSLPQLSPLDWGASALATAASGNLLPMAGVILRPGARSLALSPLIQNRLAKTATPGLLSQLMGDPELSGLGYLAAPRLGDH